MQSKSCQSSVISKQAGGKVEIKGPAGAPLELECLDPACPGNQKIKHCPNTFKELAKTLLKEFIDARPKAASNEGSERGAGDSSRIVGNFESTLPSVMCTDIGSDMNLMSEKTMVQLINAKADMTIQILDCSKEYAMAALKTKEGTEVFIQCDCKAIVSTEMQIRHAK